MVYIKSDKKFWNLIKTKNDYLDKKDKNQLTSKDKKEYKKFLKKYDKYKKSYNQKNHENINEIRTIINKHKTQFVNSNVSLYICPNIIIAIVDIFNKQTINYNLL